jgi:hypothetical protein
VIINVRITASLGKTNKAKIDRENDGEFSINEKKINFGWNGAFT